MSLERLGAAVGLSHSALSKIERGIRPYNQAQLEAIADILNTDPPSLLMRDPTDPEGIWSVWEMVPSTLRPRIIEVIRTLSKTG